MFLFNTTFYKKYRIEILIFCAVVLLRIAAMFLFIWLSNTNGFSFPVNGGDARGYIHIADNLIKHGIFSRSNTFPYLPDSFRTPGYPIFLAMILSIFRSVYAIPIIQAIISGISGIFIYKMAKILLPKRGVIFVVILYVIDPIGIFLTNVALTETLFVLPFLSSVYYFVKQFFQIDRKSKLTYSIYSGILLGLAGLVRPVAVALLPVFAIFSLFVYRKEWWPRKLFHACLFITFFLAVIFPWSLRNKFIFNSWQISTVAAYNFYRYHVPFFYAQYNNVSYEEARKLLGDNLRKRQPINSNTVTVADIPELNRVSVKYIQEDTFRFVEFYIIKTIPFFVTDGLMDIANQINIIDNGKLKNFTDIMLGSNVNESRYTFYGVGIVKFLFLLGLFFWLLINSLMFMSVALSFKDGYVNINIILFLFAIVTVMAISTGTVANARLRFPVSPLMFIMATYGYFSIVKHLRMLKYAF